jgi:F0F1-type ATP synthase membrane subunit c/vacuolar-type H+-ATPase subunit K
MTYDWDPVPGVQEAPGRAFWRGMVFGALIEAVLILGLLWALWGISG